MTKSEEIVNGLREGFKDGTTKMADRICYGHTKSSDGHLSINDDETNVIQWIFKRYLAGHSLGKIANGLFEKGIPSPTGKTRWNSEAIHKLLSNEKYTGKVLLQKTVSLCGHQFNNDGYVDQYLYSGNHPAIISEEIFNAVQSEKLSRSRGSQVMEQDLTF